MYLRLRFLQYRVYKSIHRVSAAVGTQWLRVICSTIFHSLFDLILHRVHIYGCEFVALKDPIDLCCILGFGHDFSKTIVCVFIFENAVQDTVLFGLLTE